MDSWTEQLWSCPYNPAHQIRPKKFVQHIHRCRQTAPNAHEFGICKYTNSHHVKKSEMEAHLRNCPEKVTIEKMMMVEPKDLVAPRTFPKAEDTFDLSENWDDEIQPITYDPMKKVKNSLITVTPQGLTKSKRKQYIMQERHRLNVLREKGCSRDAYPSAPQLHHLDKPVESKPAFRRPQTEPSLPRSRIAANIFNGAGSSSSCQTVFEEAGHLANQFSYGRGRSVGVSTSPGFNSVEDHFPSLSSASRYAFTGRGRGWY